MKTMVVITLVLLQLAAGYASGQDTRPADPDSVIQLDPLDISVQRVDLEGLTAVQRLTLPVTANINARRIADMVNILDPEDAVKYMPSIFLRKRNNGDTQAVVGTRVWGTSSSARSLIFADGVPLSALIANNNTIGGPRWGLIAPVEIERIDVMFGPFSAAYSGNSMGAVMEITTRLPERLEGSITQTQAFQKFDLYGTRDTYGTRQTAGNIGGRLGRFSFWASGSYQNSHSQPLAYVTAATFPTGTTGGFPSTNKLGAPANVLGATGLLHTRMLNGVLKLAYDLTPTVRAAYRFGSWRNDADAGVLPYIERSGQPTYASQAGFASGNYDLLQRHSAHSLSVRSDTRGVWDFDAAATMYSFDEDRQRTPTSAPSTGTTFGPAGRVAVLDDTGWSTLDLKGTWRPGGTAGRNSVSFGAHHDHYRLDNPTYTTADWTIGEPYTGIATQGTGETTTRALWAQDAVQIVDGLKFTVGGRFERWRAHDGVNINGSTRVEQPEVTASRFSPKASLAWDHESGLSVTAQIGKAYRFPTAAELYQLVSTGTTFTSPAPDLKPDNVTAAELRIDRQFEGARIQLALFQDDVHDAIISQFLPLVPGSTTLYSYLSNVDHVRARGAELTLASNNLLVRGLELTANATYVDAKTLAISGGASTTAGPAAVIGKRLPNIPDWRAGFTATYRPISRLAATVGGRYSGTIYSTLDNADVNPNTYQGFSDWFVMDARMSLRLASNFSAAFGIDNLLDRGYFLFHPFPQRTFVGEVKVNY